MHRRGFLRLATMAAALPTAPPPGHAQAYPTRPVRLVTGYTPAGATAYAPALGRRLMRGMLWGMCYGQWWTLWTLVSMFLWGHASLDGGLVFATVVMAVVFGFFGSLVISTIGAIVLLWLLSLFNSRRV